MTTSHLRNSHSFTMIELLIVSGLIVFMAALLLTGIGKVFDKNSKASTRDTIMKVDIAIRAFKKVSEDGLYPFQNYWDEGRLIETNPEATIAANLAELEKFEEVLSRDSSGNLAVLDAFGDDGFGNPLWVIFSRDYSISDNTDPFFDPFDHLGDGIPHAKKMVILDASGNAKLEQYYNPEGFQIISAGPDGDYDTEGDNVYNFDVY